MSDGVFRGHPTRIDDLAVMVASDCVELRAFFPTPFIDVSSVFIQCGSALVIRH
ncbi:MAG: hypothetical protein SCH39_06930 [Methanosarcinales archaeon]|nr:hypothetical protein [ANME-2 cluster archaeon]MDW7776051.1 hypothetical protein [Methanosarcinales archaeon]